MSIINDALKKAQTHISKSDKKKIPSDRHGTSSGPSTFSQKIGSPLGVNLTPSQQDTPSFSASSANTRTQHAIPTTHSHTKHSLIEILTILLVLTICGLLLALFIDRLQHLIVAPQTVTTTQPVAVQKPTETVIIKGIMTMDDKNVALLNDEIYEEGEIFNGMLITEILTDSIKMQAGNTIKTFKVPK